MSFEPLDGGEPSEVEWVSYGIDPDSRLLDDWALLSLTDDAGVNIGVRHLGVVTTEDTEPLTRLWWAAVASDADRVDTGFCLATNNRSLPGNLKFSVLEHDCELTATRPGVVLYRLDDDVPRPVAFQGSGRDAIPVESFSDVPVPISDAFVSTETFISVPVRKVYALDAAGRLSARFAVEEDWTIWTHLSEGDESFVKLDGAAEPRDFAYDALTHLWALDRSGALHVFDVSMKRWEQDASAERFIDLSVSRAEGQFPRLFALQADGRLCTRPDSRPAADWSCLNAEATGVQLDATAIATGHLVLVVLPTDLLVIRYTDDQWQEPRRIGEEGTYRVATVGSTASGIPYVVAMRTDRLRITVGDASAETWAPWSPLYGAGDPGAVSALDAGHLPGQPQALYAVVDGELLTASETPEASIERWSSDASSPAEFSPWRRIESLLDGR